LRGLLKTGHSHLCTRIEGALHYRGQLHKFSITECKYRDDDDSWHEFLVCIVLGTNQSDEALEKEHLLS